MPIMKYYDVKPRAKSLLLYLPIVEPRCRLIYSRAGGAPQAKETLLGLCVKAERTTHEIQRSVFHSTATIYILGSRRVFVAHYTVPYTLFRSRARCSSPHSLPQLSDGIT